MLIRDQSDISSLICLGNQKLATEEGGEGGGRDCFPNVLVPFTFRSLQPLQPLTEVKDSRKDAVHVNYGHGLNIRELKQMSKRIAVHVRYNSVYISLPSSPKQQCVMTKFCVVYGTWRTAANFSYFDLELNAVVAYLASARFYSHWGTQQFQTIAIFSCKI